MVVEVPVSDSYRHVAGDGDYEGAAGVVVLAGIASYPEVPRTAFVDLASGGGWTWPAAEGAHISVCRDHGDHSSADGRACLTQLGVRGAREVAHASSAGQG
ncbi:hypothetical protein ACPPVO_43560 [Dactylosporangium sp. McL0621]|uniref:hypothetical protein n=1 Tax=Dactylosporangium sp. McL0621 TaxID=3415678 RepID=UPI003CF0F0AD